MMFSMALPIDIRVRAGKSRDHRISNALDNLQTAGGPVTLRVVVEANLPRRSKGRKQAREYQRITSYLVDSRSPEALAHVRKQLRNLMRELNGAILEAPITLPALPPSPPATVGRETALPWLRPR